MVKKVLFLLFPVLIFLSSCAAGSKKPEMGIFADSDLILPVSGLQLKYDTDMSNVLSKLGDDYQYAEAVSCAFDGKDKTYTYPELTISTYPNGVKDYVLEVTVTGDSIKTAKDIGIGSSRSDITAAYGDSGTEDGIYLEYKGSTGSLFFELENEKVISFGISKAQNDTLG